MGSCDGTVTTRLNWRIIQAPLRLVDYVVVYQLAHLLHRGHGPKYWKAVERVMSNHHYRSEALKRDRAGLGT